MLDVGFGPMNDPLLPDDELEDEDDDDDELDELENHHHCASHVDAAMPVKNRQAMVITNKFRTVFFITNPFHKHILIKPFPASHSLQDRVKALKAFFFPRFLFS